MTDLTTDHLKNLLSQATPGPWESIYGVAGVPEGWDEYWVILQMGRHRLPLRSPHYPLEDEEYANFDLAALAPELAQEVIRLRKGLKAIRSDLHETILCNGGTDVPYLQGITEQAKETKKQIDQILGDHDE